jgi:hypothetical protein
MLPLLLLAADPQSAVEAERAFNRAAQTEGQWTAFRATSTADAIWFIPQPTKVHESLPPKDPPIAVQWWPAESYVSCDGSMAVNTGPWVRPSSVGYFTTVWVRQGDGQLKWTLDHGDVLAAPRAMPDSPKVRIASCKGKPAIVARVAEAGDAKSGAGVSSDATLKYHWTVAADGGRVFEAELWDGRKWVRVVRDEIAAAK